MPPTANPRAAMTLPRPPFGNPGDRPPAADVRPRAAGNALPDGPGRRDDTPAADLPTAVKVAGFNAYYGEYHALKAIDLDIPDNRVTAFIGSSGCGKSTFLRWINRMNDLVPGARAEGTLDLHGKSLLGGDTDVVALRRRVGMVFQKANPFPKSIYDNVAYGPRLHSKLGRPEADALVERALRQSALWDEVKDRLRQSALGLSGGQQQRLCIARAVAVDPEVLLMDEPCSALDPIATGKIEDLIRDLREDYTVLIVTHNMQQAARVSDHTAFMHLGEVVEYSPTAELFQNPREKQTEAYITGRFG